MNISGKYKTQHGELIIAQHGDNITATYQENGICVGKLIGNKVEGIWKNKKDQGLFVWTFDDKGSFEGNYKSGIEKGPMRGKWSGRIKDNETNESDSNLIYIEISGIGLEIVVGEIDQNLYKKLTNIMDEEDYSVKDIFENSEIRSQNNISEWFELDNLYHVYGPLYEDQTDIKIYSTQSNELYFDCKLKDLCNDFEELLVFNEAYFENNDAPILLGKNWEKGLLYSGIIQLKEGEILDPEKLKIYYDEVMLNDEIQCEIISKVEYDGNILKNGNLSSAGYLLELTIES